MTFLLPINFFTLSKNPSSSAVAADDVVGGKGSGNAGISVGDTNGRSG